jgi:hypothetical protein
MDKEEIEAIVDKKLTAAGWHEGCPWAKVSPDKIKAIEELPPGAFLMMHGAWRVCQSAGNRLREGFVLGLFAIFIFALFIGGRILLGFFPIPLPMGGGD